MAKKTNKIVSLEFEVAGEKVTLETGRLAEQATAAVLARMGDTMVHATVVEGKLREDIDYFPLTVEYVERLYAGGRIKGSRWVKREGRPTDESILIGRLIDRSIRPLFPKEYKNEVQVVVTVLSVDGEHEPDILSIIAVSAALHMSRVPWKGPIGAVRVGYVQSPDDGSELIVNPTTSETEHSELDIVFSQTKEKTHMIEAGAKQVPENVLVEAAKEAHNATGEIIKFIEEFRAKAGQEKKVVEPNTKLHEVATLIEKEYLSDIKDLIVSRVSKEGSGDETDVLLNRIYDTEKMRDGASEVDKKTIAKAMEYVMFKQIRSDVMKNNKRADGRKMDEIRPLHVEVGLLPRTHGSAIFQRGMTQALTVVTLGSPRMEQLIESAEGEESKRYIHHYSMPPYSVGEAGRMGTPSRREIGHGALAERALEAVIPSRDVFPYTIRVVSEIMSSNGSTSMASACGSTLALMDAGVPIIKPVAGISIGMMSNEEKYVLLTDIIGLEDFSGDMDFKVAGTDTGVTAIQLDVKILGLTVEQIAEIFERARNARMQILEVMQTVIPSSRSQLSAYAPKIEVLQIPVDRIGEIIGPGGKTIKHIIAQTGASVDVEDDGKVTVSGTSDESVQKAYDWVKGIVREVQVGEEFEGPVKRILSFGAFVEILPGKEGMVHVSQMSKDFVKSPEDVVQIGQVVKVRVIQIDDQGRINLSMLSADEAREQEQKRNSERNDREERHSDHPLSQQFRRERGGFNRNEKFGKGMRRKKHF